MDWKARVWANIEGAITFYNQNIVSILPFSMLFFLAAMMYGTSWYIIDAFKQTACFNGDYIIELLFCDMYLGVLGKHIVAALVSSLTIVPFAALVYTVNSVHMRYDTNLMSTLKESIPGLIKITIFRAALTLAIFSPFLFFLVLGGDAIVSSVMDRGALTIGTLLSPQLMPLPLTLILGFALAAMLDPLFQFVEYEVLIAGARVRDAIKMSYQLALRFKKETFSVGLAFVLLWAHLLIVKYTYLARPEFCFGLIAAFFLESILLFPMRTIILYNLWKDLNAGYLGQDNAKAKEELKSYTGKMLLG